MKDKAAKNSTIKKKLIYVALAVLCIALTALGYVYLDTHRTYDWDSYEFGYIQPTSPFGAYYLKEFLEEEWDDEIIYEGGYVDYDKYLSDKKKYNVLSFDNSAFDYNDETNKYDIVSDEIKSIVSLLNKGNNFIFAAENVDFITFFGLDIDTDKAFSITDFDNKENIPDNVGITTTLGDTICHLWSNMISTYFAGRTKKSKYEEYLRDIPHREQTTLLRNGKRAICVRNKVGKGNATFVGSQLLFSNYGVSREDTKQAIRYIIDNTFDKSLPLLVIFKDYNREINQETDTSVDRSNILDVLLANPGTNLAITILLITFILTLLFNSRRRRRAEEERKRERNSSINYTKHLASLYDQTSDYKELLITEQRMLLYNLRKEYRFDISTHSFTRPSEFAPMIAKSKSLDQKQVDEALRTIEYYTEKNGAINERLYIKCIEAIEFLR